MQIKLNDDTVLILLGIKYSSIFYQNFSRNSLEFIFPNNLYNLDELNTIFSDNNKTNKITVINESDPNNVTESIYSDYQIKIKIELRSEIIQQETAETPVVTEEKIFVTMAQLTYIEKQLKLLGIKI